MDNFSIEAIEAESNAATIVADAYIPHAHAGGKRCPTVILAHGAGETGTSGEPYARELARRGYAVCCPDLTGAPESRSGGDAALSTLFGAEEDLEALYDAVTSQPWADANNVFFMGTGTGAAAAALATARLGGVIKGAILLYPAFSLPDDVAHAVPDPFSFPESAQLGIGTVGRPFLETLYGFDLIGAAATYRGPVLMVHGTADDVCVSGYSVKAAKAYPHARLELVADAGHGFDGGVFKYAVRCIVDFLDEECDLADESGLEGDLNFNGGMGGFGGLGL